MNALTRRRSDNDHHETWHIYFGDVRVGATASALAFRRAVISGAGASGSTPAWGTNRSGSAPTFDEARAAFENAWQELEPALKEDNFEAWRHSRDFNAWKNRMWAEHCRLPTQN